MNCSGSQLVVMIGAALILPQPFGKILTGSLDWFIIMDKKNCFVSVTLEVAEVFVGLSVLVCCTTFNRYKLEEH